MQSTTSEEENVGETLYCICRSTDVNRFMIGCDHCEEWYHGDCIGVTEKEAKFIKKFYCIECREKNKHLTVVYKRKYADKIKDRSEKEYKKDKKEKHKEKKKKKDKDRDRDRDRSHKSKDKERHNSKHKQKDREREKDKVKIDSEKIKYKDQVIDKIKEEKIKDDSQKIKKIKEEDEKPKKLNPPLPKRVQEVKRERSKSVEKKDPDEKPRKAMAVTDVENINVKMLSDSDDEPPALQVRPLATAVKPVRDKVPAGVKRKASRDVRETAKKRKAWRPARDESDESDVEVDLTVRQCHGIDCINTARMSSKYCSDQCGLSLASLRIYQMLPERIREWNLTSCKAAETNQKELVRIRAEINTAKVKLEEVDREVETLEQLIAKVKSLAPIEKVGDSSDEEDEDVKGGAGLVNCVSCGKDVSSKLAIRHMETCFNKFESKTSYGSLYKTNIEGYEMVCDFYNAQQGTYCKRLRAICPEHTKDPQIGENEVCGYPLTRDLFRPNGEYCRVKKKECNAHYCWEKLKRGELDMERVRCWMKLDELMEKERQEKDCMSRRAGVLNLMLHSTFNHEVMDKVIKMQQKGGGGPPSGSGQAQTMVKKQAQLEPQVVTIV